MRERRRDDQRLTRGAYGSVLDWALAQNPKIIEGLIVLAFFAVYVFFAIVGPSVARANADREYVTTGRNTAPLLRSHMNPETWFAVG